MRRYILFHDKTHPKELGDDAIVVFLNDLVGKRHVSASTQSQALNALVFMYREVVGREPGELENLRRIKRGKRIPIVLSGSEVRQVLNQMSGVPKRMAELLYGAGLRVGECVTLRVKDIDFAQGVITVRAGKGNRDRVTILPQRSTRALHQQILQVAARHKEDIRQGAGMLRCQMRFTSRIHPHHGRSVGSLYSHRPCSAAGRLAGSRCDGIPRHPQFRRRSAVLYWRHPLQRPPTCIRFDMPSRRTCSPQAPISDKFSS